MRSKLAQTPWLAALIVIALLPACGGTAPVGPEPANQPGPYDLVLAGGRVMDPETETDAVLDVGIREGRVVALSSQPLEGAERLDVSGLVVAPGFIDLHAHGQDPVSQALQVRDGVTTALEMEIGVWPLEPFLSEREGKSLVHYGATAGHLPARIQLFEDVAIGHTATLPPGERQYGDDFAYREAEGEEIGRLLELLDQGLTQGGLGFGLGITYTPGASREEILRVFERAAERSVPIYVHLRGGDTLAAFQEVVADAVATGAALHVVHVNSSAGEQARDALSMLRAAAQKGFDVTTESYPYTAGSTRLESALFDSWVDLPEERYTDLQWAATGERLTAESFRRYRAVGGWVIIHGGRTEETNEWLVAQPDVMVASDGIPFLYGPAHPRGAGTFSRVLGRYVRERGALTLMEALRKMTLLPARRLQGAAPEMARKGRVKLGSDADLTVFDPELVLDRASYEQGDLPSSGIVHVLVEGVPVVRDGELVEGVFPGRPIRGARGPG